MSRAVSSKQVLCILPDARVLICGGLRWLTISCRIQQLAGKAPRRAGVVQTAMLFLAAVVRDRRWLYEAQSAKQKRSIVSKAHFKLAIPPHIIWSSAPVQVSYARSL